MGKEQSWSRSDQMCPSGQALPERPRAILGPVLMGHLTRLTEIFLPFNVLSSLKASMAKVVL